MEQTYPFEFSTLDDSAAKLSMYVGPKKYCVLRSFRKYGLSFYNFQTAPDDIVIMGLMRCGTTATQELVWLLCNNLDFQKASAEPMPERFPSLEHIALFDPDNGLKFPENDVKKIENVWKQLQEEPIIGQRRLIKTHIPFGLLSNDFLKSKCKVIYVIRDPREVAVSYYKMGKLRRQYSDFKSFWIKFKTGQCIWTPYFEHVKEAWERRNEENLMLLHYNDIKYNLHSTINRVAEFLDVKITEEEIALLKAHLEANRFQKPSKWNLEKADVKFQPKENEWKEYFVDGLEGEVEAWIEENVEKMPGFHFA